MPLTSLTPECHPERSKNPNLSSSSAAKDLDWDFCEVEVLRSAVAMQRNEAKPPQAGSAMGLRDVCSAFVAFFSWTVEDVFPYIMFFVQAACQKPAQIPLAPPRSFAARLGLSFLSAAKNLAPNACSRMTGGAFAVLRRFAFATLCKTSTRSVALRPPLAQDDTRGGGTPRP